MNRSKETLGPMVAHTTAYSSRLWMRAGDTILRNGKNFVARIISLNTNEIIEEQAFKFLKKFDNIGLIEFGTVNHLKPNTIYLYQVGSLAQNLDFEVYAKGTIKTFSDDINQEVSFVTGSCRHLYVGKEHNINDEDRLLIDNDGVHYGDKAFKSIEENLNVNPDFMIMSGDQVYCDHEEGAFFPGNPAMKLGEYYDNYYRAYSQPFFSTLASKIPIYMAMDDHEIKNDWHMDMINKNHNSKYEKNLINYKNGLKSYNIYQASLSSAIKNVKSFESELETLCNIDYERNVTDKEQPYKNKSKNLFYKFSHGPMQIFSMDVRLERYMNINQPQILGEAQEEEIKTWLSKYKSDDFVKIIITAVPMFPDTKNIWFYPVGAPEDKWGGYAEQRLRILDFIRENNIHKVVFISGDVHVSLSAVLKYKNTDIGIYSIISSAFTWPIPGLQRFNFDWKNIPEKSFFKKDKRIPDKKTRGDYKAETLTPWKWFKTGHREHNFCYVKTDGKKLIIQYYNARNGKIFDCKELDF